MIDTTLTKIQLDSDSFWHAKLYWINIQTMPVATDIQSMKPKSQMRSYPSHTS